MNVLQYNDIHKEEMHEIPMKENGSTQTFLNRVLFPGNTDITTMMLNVGAETKLVNSVGWTAAQMAAFVGEAKFLPMYKELICPPQ